MCFGSHFFGTFASPRAAYAPKVRRLVQRNKAIALRVGTAVLGFTTLAARHLELGTCCDRKVVATPSQQSTIEECTHLGVGMVCAPSGYVGGGTNPAYG